MKALPYYLAYLTPFGVLLGSLQGGLWTFQTPVWIYVVIPLIDFLVGRNRVVLSPEEAARREASLAFRLPLWLYLPTQIALTAWILWLVAGGSLSTLETVGVTLSLGMANGAIGITVAHELMHRPGVFERALAKALMLSVSYPHFCIEHIRGHHRHVATPRDPATARLGESFYAFWLRCVTGCLASAWRIERERLSRQGRRSWSADNEMLRFGLVLILVYAGVALALGALATACFALQSVIAFSMLEVINYIEHYGLARREIAPGRFEPMDETHSWNSSHRVSNWFLFELARHADHHLNAGRRYPALRSTESPELPAGYGAMLMLALVPAWWRRVMDHRALAWREAIAGG